MQEQHTHINRPAAQRIIGGATPARLRVLDRVDAAVTDALRGRSHRFHGWTLEPMLVAQGPGRGGYVVALKAEPTRGGTSSFPWDALQSVAARILENAVHVRAVVPDVTTCAPVVSELGESSDGLSAEDMLSA
jgi:GMP synthase PP-ATPase subunit